MRMMNRRIVIFLVAAVAAAGILSAQSVWEGSTAMGRYGEFPSSGYYGASDSFPRNTLVKVENLETGESVEVLIVDRLDDPGLFLLLSREASQALGIRDDQVVRSRVSLADNSPRYSTGEGDRAYHPDSDINPGADEDLAFLDRYLEPETAPDSAVEAPVRPEPGPAVSGALTVETEPEIPAAPPEEELLAEAEPAAESEPELAEPDLPAPDLLIAIKSEPEPEPEAALPVRGPVVEELYAEAPVPEALRAPLEEPLLLARSESERSVDNLYGAAAPDGEEALAVEDLPETPALREREMAIAEQFPLPEPPYNGTEESFAAAVPRLIEEQRPEEAAPALAEAAEPEAPSPVEEPEVPASDAEVEVVLEPAGERPPVEDTVAEAAGEAPAEAAVPETFDGDIQVAFRLDPQYDYLQLGVFSSAGSARSTASRFSSVYPVMVLNQDNALYKVLVGPLSPDESGALLLNFRSQGFRDAFIRKGF